MELVLWAQEEIGSKVQRSVFALSLRKNNLFCSTNKEKGRRKIMNVDKYVVDRKFKYFMHACFKFLREPSS